MPLTYNNQFEEELSTLIAADREKSVEMLTTPFVVVDFAEFRALQGYIRALDFVISELCPQVNKLLNER